MHSIVCYFLLLSVIVTQTSSKECPPITSNNVNKFCVYLKEGIVSCQHLIRPGTKAYLECKPSHEYSSAAPDPPNREVTCLEDGTWDLPASDCVPECGTTTVPENSQIVDSVTSELEASPWHVDVYHVDWTTGEFEYVCGGTLIGTELVISAAQCFYSNTEDRLENARNYAVAAGKLSRSYDEKENNQQTSQVQRIYVPSDYKGPRSSQRKDIAILRLVQSFDMTRFVRPVCIDFDDKSSKEQLDGETIGKLMGLGENARGNPCEKVQAISLRNIDHDSGSDTTTKNSEYARRVAESGICDRDKGSGLYFRSNARWYVRGIVSEISDIKQGHENRYIDRYYTAFTNVANHTPWIQAVQNDAEFSPHGKPCQIDEPQTCILPEPPEHGYFQHELCRGSCNYVQGIIFAMGTVLEYNCEKGYSLQGNSTSICQNAVWSSRPTCIQIEYCPPIPSSPNLEAVCQRDDLIVSCELDVVPGTRATLQCADEYRMNFDGDKSRLIGITCSTNGTWHTDPASYHCTPECGIAPVIDNFAHSVNGTEIYAGDVPWPVFTYRELGKKTRGNWCIGTLVKPDLVIINRGCNAALGFYDTRQDIEELRAVDTFDGLLLDDFNNKRSYHQEHSVKNHFVRKHNESSRLNNIGALRLETPFISKRYLSPLCVDWSLELDIPRAGELGMVFLKTKDKLSRYATLVIDNEECSRLRAANGHSQVTHNEFCIEVPKDFTKSVHLTVRRNGRWYLAGFTHGYFVDRGGRWFEQMTKIGYHMNWLKQV